MHIKRGDGWRHTADLTVRPELDERSTTVWHLTDQVLNENVRIDSLVGVVHCQREQADMPFQHTDHLVELASELTVEGVSRTDDHRTDFRLVLGSSQFDRQFDRFASPDRHARRGVVDGSHQHLFRVVVLDDDNPVVLVDLVDHMKVPLEKDAL